MRSVGKFLIPPYPFLSEQVRISTAETGWTELIMNINQQFVFGSQTNHIMQPSSPTMTGILYETGFHTYNSPLMQQWKKLMHLFHQGMLIDIHPYTYPFFFTVCNDTQHVQFGNHLCGISVMRSTRHIPLPVEQHIRNMMGGTEINCGYGPFGGNSRFTHNLSGPDPVRIGYLTRRIQILDDIIVFQQFSRFIGCHDNFPWGGVISDNIHRTVHDRSQCILFSRRSYQFSKTPVIYIGISWKWGESYLSTRDMTYGYVFSPQGEEMGFRDGDRILSVNGETYDDFRQLRIALLLEQNYTVEVLRDGDTVTFRTPVVSVNDLAQDAGFISPRYPFLIGQVVEGSGAAEAGLRQGDRLVELNGEPLAYFDQYTERLPQLSGTVAEVGIVRDSAGTSVVRHLPVRVSDDGRIGAAVDMLAVTPIHTMDYTFWQAVPAGTKRIGEEIGSYWKQLKLVFRPQTEAYKSLGGPLSIGSIFPDEWNWPAFWEITALLSIILAVMNILPIPALDGGHVLFLLVEVITGRKPGDKFMTYAQIAGMLLLFTLIIYATGNDIYRLFIK